MISENTSDKDQAKALNKTDVSGSALLNGKARIHFINWLNNLQIAPYSVMFDDLPIIVQHAYIIEWLDSVKLQIIIPKWVNDFYFKIEYAKSTYYESEFCYDSRQEATEKAIKKANELYNTDIKADR